MTTKDPNDSVQDEQFDPQNEAIENSKEKETENESASAPEKDSIKEKIEPADVSPLESIDEADKPAPKKDTEKKTKTAKKKKVSAKTAKAESDSKTDKEITEPTSDKKEESVEKEVESSVSTSEQEIKESLSDARKDEEGDETTEQEETTEVKPTTPAEELPQVDYSMRSRSDLVETLELLIENRPPNEIREDVDKIKILFYKKYKTEVEEIKVKFLADGGVEEEFKPPQDELESIIKRLLSKYRGKRAEYSKQFEVEKQENLKRKYEIIDKIKDLVNREESINKTFQEFRDLQNEWYSLGGVPQSSLKNLWETYNHNVEIFYDFIKINKELRDLDFKKNQELKETLCVKAEELLKDSSPISTFRTLQTYHQRWREIGPVPREERDNLWERFKEATSQINKRHHEYFEKQKDTQKQNLEAKTALCENIEEIIKSDIKSFKDWEDRAKDVIALQKEWRTIGFAPKKYNTSIYTRFRDACDKFFQEKRKFYSANKEIQLQNLEKKSALCEKAESLQESTNWKETTEEYIQLQKQWKEIGAVPRKNSDKIWKRFRNACDAFFDKKSEFFSEVDSSFEDNLKLKNALIKKLEEFDPENDLDNAFEKLKSIQEEWNSIGFVPYKQKDEVANNYRVALNKQFDKLKIDEDQKAIIKYQNKLENLKVNPKASRKLRTERDRFIIRIKQLQGDVVLWENNIGFFSKSSNADSMIKEVESKIENAHKTIEMLEEKVRLIDQSGLDE